MLATDRDLLAVEPNVFRDIAWVGQRLVSGSGTLTGGVLTQQAGLFDVSFEDADVDSGHVVIHAGVPLEVIERTGATSVTVSRLRADIGGDVIPIGDVSLASTVVFTYAPQVKLISDQVYRMLGIQTDIPSVQPAVLTPAHVFNPVDLKAVVVMGTLHMAYSGASALSSEGSPLHQRAELYRRLFALERERAVVRFDMDGDGEPEFARRLNVMRFERL